MSRQLAHNVFESNPVQPDEISVLSVDFADLLDTGETVTAKAIKIFNKAATDVTATILVTGSDAIVDGQKTASKIKLSIKSAVDAERYNVQLLATVSANKKLEADIFVPVVEVKSLGA